MLTVGGCHWKANRWCEAGRGREAGRQGQEAAEHTTGKRSCCALVTAGARESAMDPDGAQAAPHEEDVSVAEGARAAEFFGLVDRRSVDEDEDEWEY